jgi:pSer/pThr/pTyr-binding forkhead associated (FHA) protein
MDTQSVSVPSAVLNALIGVVAAAITAVITVRLQMSQERERWKKDFALKLADFQTTNPSQAAKVSQQFAVGALMLDEGEDEVQRKRTFIPFYGCLTVGKGEDNDIVVKDDLCSSKHLLFFANDREVYVLDLKSQNGTWLNGRRLTTAQKLADGDSVKLADKRSATKITFIAINREGFGRYLRGLQAFCRRSRT